MNSTVKTVLFWAVIIVSAFLLWQVVRSGSNSQKDKEVNLSQFMSDVNQGIVREVTISGQEVRGKYNEYLGYILAVDEGGKLAEMQIPTGVALALPTDLLIDDGDHVSAPTISRGDVLAMIRKPGEHPLIEVKNER